MLAPADRASLAPPPGRSSTAWTVVPDRDVAQRQVVARLDVGALAGFNLAALTKTFRSDDVSLLTIGEVQQGDTGGAVRVVLDVRDLGRHTVLVVALEVDQPVRLLVSATNVPRGDLAASCSGHRSWGSVRPATSPAWIG